MGVIPPIACDISAPYFVSFLQRVSAVDQNLALLFKAEFLKINKIPYSLFCRKYYPTTLAQPNNRNYCLYKIDLLSVNDKTYSIEMLLDTSTSELIPIKFKELNRQPGNSQKHN